jgi:cobalamin biosynthetic protein CobC
MRHGGDLHEATRLYGTPPEGWLDLSTGINPKPYMLGDPGEVQASLFRLPSPRRLQELLDAARRAYSVPDDLAILAAPGTEILIRALPAFVHGEIAIVRSSYGSYRENWPEAPFRPRTALPELVRAREASVVLVNPNNPDGRVTDTAVLLDVAHSRSPGRILIVDEAYADCDPALSVAPHLRAADALLVLRSFGKFYGLPGLRLGFAIGPENLIRSLTERLGDWPVSGPALTVATRALADEQWRLETRHWLGNQAQSLDAVLLAGGLKVAGGCALFRAALAGDAPAVHDRLARHGIWTRIFEDWPGLIRFGLPRDGGGLARLADALAAR